MAKLSKHDRKVKKIAAGYKGQGWVVRADVPGYKEPKPIRARIPDVTATKGKKTVIVEVERSLDEDRDQRGIFRDWAKTRKRTKFRSTCA